MMESQQMIQESSVPYDSMQMQPGPVSHAGAPSGRPANSAPPRPTRPDPPTDDAADDSDEHEGGTEEQVGDLTGPGAAYDDEPEKIDNDSGVAES
jgi:hypothetical protein